MLGIDIPWRLLTIGALALAVLGALGGQYVTIQHLHAGIAEQKATMSQERTNAALAVAKRQEQYREEEHRRETAQKEALDAAEQTAARARADLAIADAAAGRLRDRVAALVAAARQAAANPAPGAGSPAAADAAGMLADVLGRCITRVRVLAAVADERGTAGQLCERSYDALTPATGDPE